MWRQLRDGKVEIVGGEFDGAVASPCNCGQPLTRKDGDLPDLGIVEWPDGTFSLCHIDCLDKAPDE